ncbi:small multi-drug export protein [Desulfonatronovibrio hydrogenovorans]|uniref:small multi-drug export protein n=1 Tax=Desulfonatronovibrio hydrogenovorans TaxID=53245 RepID=UPI00048F4520|nr:small multi-drug export protein [Desulfonatronovibrio hydrogenovorans]
MDILGQYFLVFILAAVPWVELLVVIPAGLAMGLQPFLVGFIAFVGNAIPVFIIVYGYSSWQQWRLSKNRQKSGPGPSKRKQRALAIWNRYGLPGLAFSGPLLTGIHLAVVIALAFKPPRKDLLLWMNSSLIVWTIGMTIVSFYGLEGIRSILG